MSKIGFNKRLKISLVSGGTSGQALTPGVGKITIKPTNAIYFEFNNSTADPINAHSLSLPAGAVVTMDVPVLKFKTLQKKVNGINDSHYIWVHAQAVNDDGGEVILIEH
mgnify:FL=1